MNRRNKRHSKMIIAIAEMMALLALSGCSLSNPFNFPDDNGMIRHGDPINDFAEIHSDDTVGEDNNEGDNNGEGDNGSADGIEAFYTKELESLYSGIKSGTTMEISLGGDPMMMSPEYEFTNAVEGQLNHIFADLDKDGENELVLIRIQKDESVNNFNAIVEIYDKAGNGYELEDTYIVAQIYCGYITSLQFSLLESDDYCYIGIYDYYSYDMFMGQADDKNTVLKYGDGSITVDDEKFKYNSYSGFGTEGMECKSRFRKLGLEKSADCGGYYFALEDGAKNICAVEMKSNDAGTMATVEFIDNSKEEYSRSFEDLCSSGCKVVFNNDDELLELAKKYPDVIMDSTIWSMEYDISRYFGNGIYHVRMNPDSLVLTDTSFEYTCLVEETQEELKVIYSWEATNAYNVTVNINGQSSECLSGINFSALYY